MLALGRLQRHHALGSSVGRHVSSFYIAASGAARRAHATHAHALASWRLATRPQHTAAASVGGSSDGPAPQAGPAAAKQQQNYPIESAGLSAHQLQQLRTYLDYMLEVNKVMNLTAVRDPEEAWQRHIGDSLALLPVIDKHARSLVFAAQPSNVAGPEASARGHKQGKRSSARKAAAAAAPEPQAAAQGGDAGASGEQGPPALRVIDVGTGAGLPGMVLAVARPQWKVTLLDSLRKRCDFLAQAAERAGLSNVNVVWSRAEEGGQNPELREVHDLAVARAVAETRVLAELCLPFVRVGGLWVAPKGPGPQAEVDAAGPAIKKLGGRLLALEMVESFSADGQRTAVVAAKVAPTPPKYPRRPGTPNAEPL